MHHARILMVPIPPPPPPPPPSHTADWCTTDLWKPCPPATQLTLSVELDRSLGTTCSPCLEPPRTSTSKHGGWSIESAAIPGSSGFDGRCRNIDYGKGSPWCPIPLVSRSDPRRWWWGRMILWVVPWCSRRVSPRRRRRRRLPPPPPPPPRLPPRIHGRVLSKHSTSRIRISPDSGTCTTVNALVVISMLRVSGCRVPPVIMSPSA